MNDESNTNVKEDGDKQDQISAKKIPIVKKPSKSKKDDE